MKPFLAPASLLALCACVCAALCAAPASAQPKETKEKAGGVRFAYGTGKNQWGNIYQAKGAGTGNNTKPTPVYIWAHPNSDGKIPPSANDIPKSLVDKCNEAGITVISWESVPQVKTLDDVVTCRADLVKVYEWVVTNAKTYNIDINNIYIGGASRGTIVSWDFICKHPGKIRGAFLAQALPKGAWAVDSQNPLTTITAGNPPVVLTYRTGMNSDDGHHPKFGKRVADKYAELGIGDRATLLLNQKKLYAQLVEFIKKHEKQ